LTKQCAHGACRFGEDNWKGLLGTIEEANAKDGAGAPMRKNSVTTGPPTAQTGQKAKPAVNSASAPKATGLDMDFTKFAQGMIGGILELEDKGKTAGAKPNKPAPAPVAKASGF